MKGLIASAVVVLGLLSTATAAQADTGVFSGYPEWARSAFSNVG